MTISQIESLIGRLSDMTVKVHPNDESTIIETIDVLKEIKNSNVISSINSLKDINLFLDLDKRI